MPPLIDSAAIGSVKPESNPTEWSFVPPISSSSFFPPPPNNATAPANISKSSTLLSGLHESSAGDSIENKLVHYLSKSLATPLGEIVSHFKNQFNKKQINHVSEKTRSVVRYPYIIAQIKNAVSVHCHQIII